MNHPEYKKEVDQLALGLTRTPMFMGVNVRVFFANVVICTLICINVHTFWVIPFFVMLHLIFVRLFIKDPHFLSIKTKALVMTPPVLNRWYWGDINSYEPW